jgi:hypothetical protein
MRSDQQDRNYTNDFEWTLFTGFMRHFENKIIKKNIKK